MEISPSEIAQPLLLTARLRLVAPDESLAGALVDFHERNRAHLAPWDPPARCLLLLGHETRGVPDLPQAVPARVAHEPQVESLNVAMAGSILLADWYRKRRA